MAPGSRTRTRVSARAGRSNALQSDRAQPVVAAGHFERRGPCGRRELVPELGRSRLGHHGVARLTFGGPFLDEYRLRSRGGFRLPLQGQGLAPAVDNPLAVGGLEERQVGPDLHREPFVARGQQPPVGAQAHHGEVGPLRPAFGGDEQPSRHAQPGRVRCQQRERDRDQQADEQGPEVGGRAPAVPEQSPVGGGEGGAGLPDGQSHHRRRGQRRRLAQEVRELEHVNDLLAGPRPVAVQGHRQRELVEPRRLPAPGRAGTEQ